MPRCAIFDIDGVLADVRHRLHHLEQRPKDWHGFFSAMDEDPLLARGHDLVHEQQALGHRVVYVTGRSETYRQPTLDWFARHEVPTGDLHMRKRHDRRPARIVKREILARLGRKLDIVLVVDDDEAVVETLREAGYEVLHATWMFGDAAEQAVLFDAQERRGRT